MDPKWARWAVEALHEHQENATVRAVVHDLRSRAADIRLLEAIEDLLR